tara:strand:+ start:355 stop:567 length:213 start_codon:yes stop_codon:yes gene_type:complete
MPDTADDKAGYDVDVLAIKDGLGTESGEGFGALQPVLFACGIQSFRAGAQGWLTSRAVKRCGSASGGRYD